QRARLAEVLPLRRVRSGTARIANLGPPMPGKPHDPDWEFCARPICGQRVDRRDFRQVMGHEQPDHEPLELDQ
ncbi:hypothetical protein, partial [Mesorhizobium sp. M0058]|uniref:hypothetical protein n=1 Tax=Mesorhizobium sp. M0058 TaxID=2956865 RepID=UPI0033398569